MVIVKSFDFLFSAPLVAEDCKHALKNFLTRVRSTASPLALAKNFGRAIFFATRGELRIKKRTALVCRH